MEEWPCTLDPVSKQGIIDDFMSRKYTLVADINDKAERFYCQVAVSDLKK